MTATDKIRTAVALQLDRVMKVASVTTVPLLILNLSVSATLLLKWLGGPLWAWVAGCSLVLLVGILVFAHLWTHSFDMVRAMRRAYTVHDPCQVYQLWPYERTMWLNVLIPNLEAQSAIALNVGATKHAEILLEQVGKLRRWEALGFIPREEYPEHLLGYYLHGGKAL